jgi:hypothetical protein
MNRETVLSEHRDGVALLTLNRPSKRNAFNDQQYDDLRDALADAQADDTIKWPSLPAQALLCRLARWAAGLRDDAPWFRTARQSAKHLR